MNSNAVQFRTGIPEKPHSGFELLPRKALNRRPDRIVVRQVVV
jgi:hypothetical protein